MSRQTTPSSPVKKGKKLTPEQQTIRDRVAQLIPNWATVEVEDFCATAGWDVQEVQNRLAARQEENPAHLCETEAWTDAPKRKQKDESARKRGRGRGRGGGRENHPRTKSSGDRDAGGEKEKREPKEFSARGRGGRGGRRSEKTRKPEQPTAEVEVKKEVVNPFAGRSFASLLKPAPLPEVAAAPAQPVEKPRRWTKLTKKDGSVLLSKAARGEGVEEVKPVEEQKAVQAVVAEVVEVVEVAPARREEVAVAVTAAAVPRIAPVERSAPAPAPPLPARPPKIVSQLLTAPSAVMLPATVGPQEVTISFGSFGISTPPTSPRKQVAASPEETSVSLDGYGGLDMALSRENAVAMATSVLSSPDPVLLMQAPHQPPHQAPIQAPIQAPHQAPIQAPSSQLSPKQSSKLEVEESHEATHPPLQHQYFNQPSHASQSEAAFRGPFPPDNSHMYDLNQRQGFTEPYVYDSTYFNQVPLARRGNAPQYRGGTVARGNPKGKMDGSKDGSTQMPGGTPPKQSPSLQSAQASQQYNLPYGQQQQQAQQQSQQQQQQPQQQQQQRPQGQFNQQQQYQQSFKQGSDRRAPNNFNKQHQAGAYPMNVPYGGPYMFPYVGQYYGQPVPQFPPGFQQRGGYYAAPPFGFEYDYNRGYGQEVGGMNPNEEETLNAYEGANKPQSQAGSESTSQASAGQKPKAQGTQFVGQPPYPQSFPAMVPNFQSGDRYNWTGQ